MRSVVLIFFLTLLSHELSAQYSATVGTDGRWELVATNFGFWKNEKRKNISFHFVRCQQIEGTTVASEKMKFCPHWTKHGNNRKLITRISSKVRRDGTFVERTVSIVGGPRIVVLFKTDDLMILGFSRFLLLPKGIDVVSKRPISCSEIDSLLNDPSIEWQGYLPPRSSIKCLAAPH